MSIDHKDVTFSQLQVVRAPRHTLALDREPNWRYAPLTPKEQLSNIAWKELHIRAAIEQISGTLFERAANEIEQLRKERDEAWLEKGRIMNEIDCRIEHGADSNGHLEAIRKLFSKQALEKMTRLDEEMGLL